MTAINWKQQSTIGRGCGTALRSRLTRCLARGTKPCDNELKNLPYIPRVGILRSKRWDAQRVKGSQKSEIFFSTRNSCISNNRKLASKSSYSSITPSTMKTSLIVCLLLLSLALTSLAQSPAAPQTSPAAGAPAAAGAAAVTSPGAPAAISPGAPAAISPGAPTQMGSVPPGQSPAAAAPAAPAADQGSATAPPQPGWAG